MLVIDAVLSSLASLSRFHRWFRELKNRTKRFYNNVNSKTLKSLEDLVAATAAMHNIIRAGGEEVIPTRQSPSSLGKEYIARGSWIGLGCRWLSS
jgi:ribosomal protein L16 Arg81 hydroxylase